VVGAAVVLRALLWRRRLAARERAGAEPPRVLGRGRLAGAGPGGDRRASRCGGLLPDRQAAGELDDGLVAEAAHAPERAEVVVERPVLLHQDQHVPDVAEVTEAGSGLF
jgi:hypothetical protein